MNGYDLQPSQAGLPLIRVSREHVAEAGKYIDSTWDRLAPKVQIRRKFTDALFNEAYQGFSTLNATLNGLAAFAFLIAIMGCPASPFTSPPAGGARSASARPWAPLCVAS